MSCMGDTCSFIYLVSVISHAFIKFHLSQPGATTRKSMMQADKQNSEVSYYADDEDGNQKKYTKRGENMLCGSNLHK